jgi:hypothetical protein
MKASLVNLAAAGLIVAAGLSVSGATGAVAGLRPPGGAHPAVSPWRGAERHAAEEGWRRHRRGQGGGLDLSGAVGQAEDETPAAEEEEAPQTLTFYPPVSGLDVVVADFAGPRIIEIGGRAPKARRGALPVVVYGDYSP